MLKICIFQVQNIQLSKKLTNASQHNLTRLKCSKKHIKPHPNPHWKKPRFRVKSKMAAIIKPVIYIYIFFNRHYFRTKYTALGKSQQWGNKWN